MADALFEDFFGAGGEGIFPQFLHQDLSNHPDMEFLRNVEGFLGNGDYIVLPVDDFSGSVIDYKNAAGVSQPGWPIAATAINSNVNIWLGFVLDGSTLFVTAMDVVPNPRVVYTVTININGNITNLPGSPATLTDTATIQGVGWADNGLNFNNNRGTNMYRDSFGSGNLNVLHFNDGSGGITNRATAEIIIDSVTGVLIQSSFTNVGDFGDSFHYSYKTPNGVYVGLFKITSFGLCKLHMRGPLGKAEVDVPLSTGIAGSLDDGAGTAGVLNPLMWKNYITYAYGSDQVISGTKANTKAGFDAGIDLLAQNLGILS